jgi:ribosomal peptide maturation radical SAM protein 1
MKPVDSIMQVIQEALNTRRQDALIIVPPFAGIDRPALGVHLLQAEAKRAGFEVSILYANLLFAQYIGTATYDAICYASATNLVGESCFRSAAFGDLPSEDREANGEAQFKRVNNSLALDPAILRGIREIAPQWCDEVAKAVAAYSFRVVGCTTTFEQTCASIALLNRIKGRKPDAITILGGANCEGDMAQGIMSLGADVDYVFSGESEGAFVAFLQAVDSGDLPSERIVHSKPNYRLDDIPAPSFQSYFDQLRITLPEFDLGKTRIPYESSRGCWWGEKHHCTFCGLNGESMGFRQKSPDTVLRDLSLFKRSYLSNKVIMVDNIMPHSYFSTLLPRLGAEVPGLQIFYEQKANLTLSKVELLKQAGVEVIQPGIEALSTPLLKMMRKGVRASQNLALLRYARSTGLAANWNLLFAFPGDKAVWYESTIALMPYITHLQPPNGSFKLSIDRFSPYYNDPDSFGMKDVRAITAYHSVFPTQSDIEKIGYHFQAEYVSESAADDDLSARMQSGVESWKDRWRSEIAPRLHVTKLSDEIFILHDTRGLEGIPEIEFIDEQQAKVSLIGNRGDAGPDMVQWALARSACVIIDDECVPLATADPELLHSFEVLGQQARAASPSITLGAGENCDAISGSFRDHQTSGMSR